MHTNQHESTPIRIRIDSYAFAFIIERFNGRIADVLPPTGSTQLPPSRLLSNASFTSIITTSRKKVYTTKRPSKYSNIGTLKNPPFSKKPT